MSSTFINKDESSQPFNVSVEVRDENGKMYLGEGEIKVKGITYESWFTTWEQVEYHMKEKCRQFKAFTPKGSKINLSMNMYNSISDTWMVICSYYGDNNRFVKH